MLRIAICDDVPDQIKRIQAAVEQYLADCGSERAELACFDDPVAFLDRLEEKGGFDIVLLDIFMPRMSGMDVAKKIRARKDKTEIIFLTTSDEFAIAAFSLKAAHYLLKPFTQKQFNEGMSRALEAINSQPPPGLTAKLSGGGVQTVELKEILYAESFGHEQQLCLKGGARLTVRESMTGLLEQLETLSPGQFLSPYKGYIVNLEAVSSVEPDCMRLHGGASIPIVRRNFRALSAQRFCYAFGKNQGGETQQ